MFFRSKKNKIDYRKQLEFCFYTKNRYVFYDFLSELTLSEFQIEKVIGESDYFSDFEKIIEIEFEKGLMINLSNNSCLNVTFTNKNNERIVCVSFSFFFNSFSFIERLDSFISKSLDIYYAYLSNYYDMKWQGEESLAVYKSNNISLKGLSFSKDIFDMKCVDVSKNYGRGIYKDGVFYVAAYNSWFGEIRKEFEIFDLTEKYKSSSVCKNGAIKIELFENIFVDYESVREIQKQFLLDLGVIPAT